MTIEDENLRKLKEAYKLWDETNKSWKYPGMV